jgi:hypothetical protein
VVFAAAPVRAPSAYYGIYQVSDDWSKSIAAPVRLFDDPNLVDAEPVAVYPRSFVPEPVRITPPVADTYPKPSSVKLASGATYAGPIGFLENLAISAAIRNPIPWHDRSSGRPIDPRENPLVAPPPNVTSVAVYSDGRDRFDDPDQPRVLGSWEKQLILYLSGKDQLTGWVPSNPLQPSVLVGLDEKGKVARWTTPASGDRPERTYLAYAGDHYSGTRPDSYNYCNGCHTGHTFKTLDATERLGRSNGPLWSGK